MKNESKEQYICPKADKCETACSHRERHLLSEHKNMSRCESKEPPCIPVSSKIKAKERCEKCGGTGLGNKTTFGGDGLNDEEGYGFETCMDCNGTGFKPKQESVKDNKGIDGELELRKILYAVMGRAISIYTCYEGIGWRKKEVVDEASEQIKKLFGRKG